jgi:hypothetical protein
MRTSRKFVTVGLTCLLFAMSLQCASGECDQYSDCAQGYRCTAGKCLATTSSDGSTDSPIEGASSLDSSLAAETAPSDSGDDATDAAGATEASDALDAAKDANSTTDATQDTTGGG